MWDSPRLLNLAAGVLVGLVVLASTLTALHWLLRSPLFPLRVVELRTPLKQAARAHRAQPAPRLAAETCQRLAAHAGTRCRARRATPRALRRRVCAQPRCGRQNARGRGPALPEWLRAARERWGVNP